MEPSDRNRRAFDEAHRTSENVLATPGIPEPIRERLQGVGGSRVLHLLCGTGGSRSSSALGALVTGVDDDEAAIDAARHRHPRFPGCTPMCTLSHPSCCSGAGTSSTARRLACRLRGRRRLGSGRRRGAASRRRAPPPRRAPCRRLPRRFGRWRGDYFASAGVGELVDAVTARGSSCAGSRSGPGKDARIPSHLVLAAERPEA